MSIFIKTDFFIKRQNKQTDQIRIIIPKKCIKQAVIRNKIRRQIRTILFNNNIKSCLVKYYYNDTMNFNDLQKEIKNKLI